MEIVIKLQNLKKKNAFGKTDLWNGHLIKTEFFLNFYSKNTYHKQLQNSFKVDSVNYIQCVQTQPSNELRDNILTISTRLAYLVREVANID